MKKIFVKTYYIFDKIRTFLCFLAYGRRCDYLFVLTPTHGNLGDQAIALAEVDFFKTESVSFFEVTAENLDGMEKLYSFFFFEKKQRIVIHGGGYLGDLWKKEENRFRAVIKNFKDAEMIVMPQTVTFDLSDNKGKSFFNESYFLWKQNLNLTFFLRDKNSCEFILKEMPELKFHYVPDIVLNYKWAGRKSTERKNILFLFRHDIEKNISDYEAEQIKCTVQKIYDDCEVVSGDTVINSVIFPFQRKNAVNKKLEEIATYRLVVTDRLHGMIFAFLTKTPCIALSNKNGKVKSVYDWIKSFGGVIFLENLSELENALENVKLNGWKESDENLGEQFDELRKLLKRK